MSFGILLGLGVSACVHLATWTVIANASPSERSRALFVFLNMATYHLIVLTWLYSVIVQGNAFKEEGLSDEARAGWAMSLEFRTVAQWIAIVMVITLGLLALTHLGAADQQVFSSVLHNPG